jgi:predicted nucleic acid-binding protein
MFERLCASNIVGDINRDVLDMAVDIHVTLRRAGRMIEDADILIAATPFGL